MRNASTMAVHAVALTAILGGTSGYLSLDRTVTLSVDGQSREVGGFARTVGAVLDHEHVALGAHDTVSPGLGEKIVDGQKIAVRHATELDVTVDGTKRTVWTTAETVGEAVLAMDLRSAGAYLSVSRGMPLGRTSLSLDLRTAKEITVVDAGEATTMRTNAATVAEALRSSGQLPDDDDRVSGDLTSTPRDGQRIVIDRVATKTVDGTDPIAFTTVQRSDASLLKGTTKVVNPGDPGLTRSTWEFTYVNGEQSGKTLLGTVVSEQPAARVIAVGTKVPPAPKAATRSTARSSSVAPRSSNTGLNWGGLAACESGGNPRAVSSHGYYGLYQFSIGTWRAVGGSGSPVDASPAEQTARAQMLYNRRGASPWPVCGSRL